MAILVKNLKKKVLENAKESDQIIIITGYFSPDMIDEIAKMGVPFVYYYGMYKLMKLAGTEESIGVETLDDYAVQKIIGWFQQQEDIDLELRSDIEFIYLPMLDDYSEVRPRALNTRLSLEPEYFCSLIELCYKERNGEKREIELNKSLSDRLYEILFQFKVIPGIDWNGKLCLALRGSVKEETLFNKLVEAFSKVNTDIQVEKIHGRRWCVEFDNTAGNFYWKGKTTRCELGDLLFVVTDGQIARIAIMQNKFERGMVDYDKSFKAQMNQLFLLKERPEFRYKNNTIDMLKKARLPSIGNYGTFRQNASPYEMGYYSADCLLHRANCAGPRSQCKIRLDVGVNKTDKIAGYIQENYCENIAEFGDALIGMRIGEPYLLLNAIKILNNINIVNVLRQWDMAIEYEVDDRRPSITCRDIILVNVRQYYETKNDRKIRSIKERLEKEGELLEMKKPEEEFIDAMRYLFGEEFVKNEKFTEKYKKVLKRDDELKGHYGDCDSVKQLMLYIRKNMRKYGYAPNYKLPEIFENNELDYNKYREAVIEGMRNSKFEKLFPETYTYEFKRNKLEYDTDGWNYNKMDYQEEDWICKKRGSYHCYYNQLDHYLSHLLSVIRKNSEMGNCQGIEPVRMELKQKIDSYCMAKKER